MRDDHPEIGIDPYKYVPTKPLYMLIKVEVDKNYIRNQQHADEFANDFGVDNKCKIIDTYYPDDEQFPYIAK